MTPPYLLIGNELALYREVLAGVLQVVRPAISMRVVPAADLDATVACQRPWLLICSAVSPVVEASVPAWILLHPNENRETIVSVRGERRTVPHPTVEELVQLVDEAWRGASVTPLSGEKTSRRLGEVV